ncbi:orotidine-5'-phosphate decarboxylase [Helicovermis profundi]|uniref:Orotidine 5'-phosphate decarboxylase n=1 Tax=Helicovermis profundi TaxID=3065157 RepID=A0AAU9EF22_9FIRM|nr:orotidine-5'-phosphate decarboxylase [Clostridia bacterium S502]
MIIDKLIEKVDLKKSHIVVGLDPRIELMPENFISKKIREGASLSNILFEFNKKIIDSVYDLVPAVKPQVAYYEMYGIEGMIAFRDTIKYAKEKGLIVISDVKRSDIGSTSKAYSNAHLGKVLFSGKQVNDFKTDAVTINPYLGSDTVKEFIEDIKEDGGMIFLLVKTSNKSSGEIQDRISNNKKIYEYVCASINSFADDTLGKNNYHSIGAVTGATYSSELSQIRKLIPRSYLLVPGYGAQGGKGSDVVSGFNKDGLGALVNSSRGIIYAFNRIGKNIGESARIAVKEMNEDINLNLKNVNKYRW